MQKINVLGSLNMDLVTHVKVTPKVGETILGDGFIQIPGGKGANQAATIGRLGGQVSIIGKVGNDSFGKQLISSLKSDHVETLFIEMVADEPTGTALIMVNADGDNSIVVIPGANFKIRIKDLTPEKLDGDYLVAQLEVPIDVIASAFKIAKEKGLMTILNPAPARLLSKELIENVDLLIPNESEFKLLTGCDAGKENELNKGVSLLISKGVKQILITLGSKGSVLCDGKSIQYFDAHQVKAVDTTAAGDSFIGGLLYSLSSGKSIEEGIKFASKVAAITVTRKGAQSSLPNLNEVIERYGV